MNNTPQHGDIQLVDDRVYQYNSTQSKWVPVPQPYTVAAIVVTVIIAIVFYTLSI
jgi:uncharacterized protein (DUF2062 family)